MCKKILLTIILLNSVNLFAQKGKDSSFSKRQGILIFEGQENVYNMYFIETSTTQLAPLFNKMDTIKIILIGTPGDDANDVIGYQEYLSKSFTFDSLSYISIIDDNGLYIEDTCTIKYKSGYINYTKSKGYKLRKRYEKRKINGRLILYEIEDFIPVNSFIRTSGRRRAKKLLGAGMRRRLVCWVSSSGRY